jgi:YVTN family beta-propeller protein
MRRITAAGLCLALLLAACAGKNDAAPVKSSAPTTTHASAADPGGLRVLPFRGSPPPKPKTDASGATVDVYAHTRAGDLSARVAGIAPRVYVPNSMADTVDVIDPATYTIIDHFSVGKLPQHVTPSWDLSTLYVDNDEGNSLTPIDARTGRVGATIPVEDPYNLYFTPDGSKAIVVAERLRRLDFRDPHTWALIKSLPVPCVGVDHADFTADGKTMLASCEFSGDLVRVDIATMTVTDAVHLGGRPIDVKLSPDGTRFYIADQDRGGVIVLDAHTLALLGFVNTGAGAHGLYPSRDGRFLYVTNRSAGSISVLNFATGAFVTTWHIGGSPDMGGVNADGTQLWVSGRYNNDVYVIDTRTGALLHTIAVGAGPHGLDVFPQPGRYSLGHTGIYR